MFSRPRAVRAAALLPASRLATRATASAMGEPFQWVTSTPAARWGSPVMLSKTLDTNHFGVPSAQYCSSRMPRNANGPW